MRQLQKEGHTMQVTSFAKSMLIALTGGIGMAFAAPALALDEDAAMALAKKSNCTKCHSADKKKEGPAYKETAAKYKGKADAQQKLFVHLTTSPMVKVDGNEEKHANPKTTDEAEIKNLVAYILSR
jgi:cytochrome c